MQGCSIEVSECILFVVILQEAVIRSERARRLARLRGHYRNNIWKKRDSPPSDFDKPLPEWMVKRDENTYLALKAKEMREDKTEEANSYCSIM